MKGFFKIILNLIVIALAMFVGIKIGQQQKNHINYDTFIQQIEDTNLLEHEKLNFENKINNKIDLEQNRNMINEININDNTNDLNNEFNNEMNEEASTQETFKNDIIIQENLNFEEQNKNNTSEPKLNNDLNNNTNEIKNIDNQNNNINNNQQILENKNNPIISDTKQVPNQPDQEIKPISSTQPVSENKPENNTKAPTEIIKKSL